jgi:glycerophosphoryl diester phosphodiesterase
MSRKLDLSRFRHPLVIGHRGWPAKYPENTLASFQAALEAGCDMIELDVTLTSDRRVAVIHDDTLERTTSGRGPVSGATLAEIKTLDAGGWFDPRFAGERVPELCEVFDLIAGRCALNVEIKASAFEEGFPQDAIERQVAELVRRRNAASWVLVGSFERRVIERIAAMDDAPAVSLISQHPAEAETLGFLERIGAFSWNPLFKILTRDQVETIHDAGMRVFAWTINTRPEAEKTLALGADGIICNDPRVGEEALPR